MNTARIVVVTGGGSGIGRAVAQRFHASGDQVVLLGRRVEPLQSAVADLGERAVWLTADVGQRTEVVAAVERIVRDFGRVDILINNAGFVQGTSTATPIADAERAWDEVLNANLKGSFLMSFAVTPHLPRPGGRIINISSIAAYTGGSRGGSAGYAAAKAGVHGLTMGLARELGSQGITVNAVAPGLIADTAFFGGPMPEERLQAVIEQTPVGRAGRSDDVAAAVFYLASPEASFITGEVLNVNGGWLFGR